MSVRDVVPEGIIYARYLGFGLSEDVLHKVMRRNAMRLSRLDGS